MLIQVAALLTITACQTTPPPPAVDLGALQQEAEQLYAAEELEASLQTYAQLVSASSGTVRGGFLIAGADILIRLEAYDSAGEWLARAMPEATPDQALQIAELQERLALVQSGFAALQRIGLLLPLTGPQRQAAIAIQDGFLAAHLGGYDNGTADLPTLEIYDTGALGALEAYRRARDDGAEFIVGPLLKPELEAVIGDAGATPTLALNSLEGGQTAASFYQFALAPEDEAREAARYAVEAGAVNAVALIPRNEWGERLLNSFRTQLEILGGQLLQVRTYDPAAQDFSSAITMALNIDKSDARSLQLRSDLGIPVVFESRRRGDIDFIFVAADARAARLLAPQLRFYFAGDLPTYATSAIYESSTQNSDLEGLFFADTPWVLLDDAAPQSLVATLQRYWPQRSSAQWTRFYGLGFDAYRLMSLLHREPGTPGPLPALSGELSVDADGRVRRELPLARFEDGQPVAVEIKAGEAPEPSAELAGLR